MRLLIQQASWCCRPEPGRLGSPGRGSECPVIDQFSLSVHTGPGQRSGGDSPGGHSHCARECRRMATLCKTLRSRCPADPAGPVPLRGIASPRPSPCACGISLQATAFRKPAGLSHRSRRAAVRTWWAALGGGRGSGLGARPRGSASAVGSGGPCFTRSAVSSWGSRAACGSREDELTQEAWRAQGRPGRAGAGPARAGLAARLTFSSSGGFRRAGRMQPCSSWLGVWEALARLGRDGKDPTTDHLPGQLLLLGEVCAVELWGGSPEPPCPALFQWAGDHPPLPLGQGGLLASKGASWGWSGGPPGAPWLPEASAPFSAVSRPCSHELVAIRLGWHSWGPGPQRMAVLRPPLRARPGSPGPWGPGSQALSWLGSDVWSLQLAQLWF